MEIRLLKKSIRDLLLTAHERVYEYTRVPKDATFPYVAYNLITSVESLRDSDADIVFNLEIDCLDYKDSLDSAAVDQLLDSVNNAVNRVDVIEDTFFYRINRQTLLSQLPTPDEYTLRRQFVGELTYNEGSI